VLSVKFVLRGEVPPAGEAPVADEKRKRQAAFAGYAL
jgi:hypothetical protein